MKAWHGGQRRDRTYRISSRSFVQERRGETLHVCATAIAGSRRPHAAPLKHPPSVSGLHCLRRAESGWRLLSAFHQTRARRDDIEPGCPHAPFAQLTVFFSSDVNALTEGCQAGMHPGYGMREASFRSSPFDCPSSLVLILVIRDHPSVAFAGHEFARARSSTQRRSRYEQARIRT